jgi:hypothetical protein
MDEKQQHALCCCSMRMPTNPEHLQPLVKPKEDHKKKLKKMQVMWCAGLKV